MRRYTVDKKLLTEKPEIEIGDKIYTVDDRLKNFEKMNEALSVQDKDKDKKQSEIGIIIEFALGKKALKEIEAMDLSFSASMKIAVLIMAGMQGITEEEAEKRFQD